MELMKKIILSSCFISIVISVADSIKPSDKFTGQLKLIFSLVFVCGILTTALSADFNFDFSVETSAENLSAYEEMEDAADSLVISAAEESVVDTVCAFLQENKTSYEKITATIDINEDNSINIIEIGYKGDDFSGAKEVIVKNIGETEVNEIE